MKIIAMALINASLVYILMAAIAQKSWVIAAAATLIIIILDWAYFSRRTLALKYLIPGILFLAIFQVFGILYNGYIAFTNYGDGHVSSQAEAVDALLAQNERRVEGSAPMPLVVVTNGDELGLAVVIDDAVMVGTAEEPLREADGAQVEGGRPADIPGWSAMSMADILQRQSDVLDLRVPMSEDVADGAVRTPDGQTAYIYRSSLVYDSGADVMTDTETGVTYVDNGRGNYVSEDGERLAIGWVTTVGWENFAKPFTDQRFAPVFLQVFVWSVAFAVLSVALSFFVGLIIAIVMNHKGLRGQKVYRSIMIVPYAFPGFMSALLWAGMLNTKYGFINGVFFGGAEIPWLTDPWLAKFSILAVNTWLGFPYMFLICTGALQAIPQELTDAARIDGASGPQIWRRLTLPLLLVAVAPLLIAGFAFNFNNFSLIYMLTRGGPAFSGTGLPVGQTDILISMVYQISGLSGTGTRDYALASALSILIFIVVGIVSYVSFRQTRQLEDIH